MANLLIEIGNTALKAAWSEGMTLGKTFRYQGEKVIDYICSLTARERPDLMVVSCVYPLSAYDADRLSRECGKMVLLDGNHPQILGKYGLPAWLTYDRAASILAVRHLFQGRGCTLFDFGTTLTVDLIDASGSYLGGNISPGCRTRFKALNKYSRSLPRIATPEKTDPVGTSLEGSIASGVISGILFEIEGYLALHPENVAVFTGGDANYFAKRMKNSIFAVCNLVLMGLALIAEEYED
ncbi:MAG: type III pantothenate kinase [Bacteroidales bacterium]|jgi:type III pantothenate kinase|nr:type III pantothenate kinase [Bacteroidales bacterium]MBQ2331565.1 type III pantothenate kinase [Bacteroidales bacterium]MBR1894010.1 type III pantothenate kinase [Bacteroidales bacterium]MDY6464853.1 type III pantothenate kinase [Bacteroidales bacterium]